jgi:NitT/TauT family transport system ATP-binding protein
MMTPETFVDMRDVTLTYGRGDDRVLAVDHLDMTIEKGNFVAVVGPSGCGKSSLMKLLTGLIPASKGEIVVGDRVVKRPIDGVGMAFQNSTLLPWRTTLSNIMLPFEIVQPHMGRLRTYRSEYEAAAQKILASVGLGKFGDKFPWQLSGGMQQRANLCRALIHEPQLLMLDEPFGALDAFTREGLWAVMQALWTEKRFTAVLVTHDLREAAYLSNTVHVMSKRPGRIIYSKKVDLPRPRTLEMTYDSKFVDIVHDLREHISSEHEL